MMKFLNQVYHLRRTLKYISLFLVLIFWRLFHKISLQVLGLLCSWFGALLYQFLSVIKQTFHRSLVSLANHFSTIVQEERAVSGLSAKIQDSVNAQVFIWTQFL